MTINFEQGNFAVYESKKEKGRAELETLKYFNNYDKACAHMSRRLIEEVYETKNLCGYEHENTIYQEAERTPIKDRGFIIKEKTTGDNVLVELLFVSPTALISPYDF